MKKDIYNKGKGAAVAFLRASMSFSGEECLTWPFFIDDDGYGRFRHEGRNYKAHRWMCEAVRGKPPEGHVAAHDCGNGHLGCVNPNHLFWRTRAENGRDSIRHGRAQKEKGKSLRKLTHEQVAMLLRPPAGTTVSELRRKFGITHSYAWRIRRGDCWKHGHDKAIAETDNCCERNGNAKLGSSQVRDIRSSGDTTSHLSKRYGVARSTINRIKSGQRWAKLDATAASFRG